jgi:hypothetical protein
MKKTINRMERNVWVTKNFSTVNFVIPEERKSLRRV